MIHEINYSTLIIWIVCMLAGMYLCFRSGKLAKTVEILHALGKIADDKKELAIKVDAYMLDKDEIHRPSYDCGYFMGQMDFLDTMLDIVENDKQEKGRKHDTNNQKRNKKRKHSKKL